jgi:site-specific recombinase XerD
MYAVVDEFIRYLKGKERSKCTVTAYEDNMNRTLTYFVNNNVIKDTSINSITTLTVANYTDYMCYLTENGLGSSAKNQIISAIRTFYIFMIEKGYIKPEQNVSLSIEKFKKPRRLPKFLTKEEASQLIDTPNGCNEYRDKAIIYMFLTTGLRLSELSSLNVSDIRTNEVNVIGKENAERIVYITDECREYLNNWLSVRKQCNTDALFISNYGKRLDNTTLEKMVKKYLKQIGRGDCHLHNLRHTYFTTLASNGTPLNVIQQLAGWMDTSTAAVYVHAVDKQVKSEALKLKF